MFWSVPKGATGRSCSEKLLLADTAAEDDPELSVVSFWKQLNMKDVMFMITKAWNDVPETTVQASWNKLLVSQDAEELVEEPPVQEFLNALEFIPGCGDCDETNVKDWIEMDSNDQGYQIQDDDEIARTITDGSTSNAVEEEECDTECTEEERACPSHAEVQDMLTKCLP